MIRCGTGGCWCAMCLCFGFVLCCFLIWVSGSALSRWVLGEFGFCCLMMVSG